MNRNMCRFALTIVAVTLLAVPPGCEKKDQPGPRSNYSLNIARGMTGWSGPTPGPIPGITCGCMTTMTVRYAPNNRPFTGSEIPLVVWSDLNHGSSHGTGNGAVYDGHHFTPEGQRAAEFRIVGKEGRTVTITIGGNDYDLGEGALFLVSTQGPKPRVLRLPADLARPLVTDLTKVDVRGFAQEHAEIRDFFDKAAPATRPGAEMELDCGKGVYVKLVYIPPGKLTIGSPAKEERRMEDEMPHQVTLTRGFYMGVYEVTQEQYEVVMGKNPSWFSKDGAKHPVERVSWNDAMEFCRRLSQKTGMSFRLPTAAEWEYACRAGTRGPFAGTGNVDEMGWYSANSANTTHPVASKKPNAWGLYDMHGNVWEWCSDPAKEEPAKRVACGGSIGVDAEACGSGACTWFAPTYLASFLGFRIAADCPPHASADAAKTAIAVTPGDVDVTPGCALVVDAVPARAAGPLRLYVRSAREGGDRKWRSLAMWPDDKKPGHFFGVVAKITEPMEYYVEMGDVKSGVYRISIEGAANEKSAAAKPAGEEPRTAADTVDKVFDLLTTGDVDAAAKYLYHRELKRTADGLKSGKLTVVVAESREDGDLAVVILKSVEKYDTRDVVVHRPNAMMRTDGTWRIYNSVDQAEFDGAVKEEMDALWKWAEGRCADLNKDAKTPAGEQRPTAGGATARGTATRTQLSTLSTALDAFEVDCGRYPTEQEGLRALVADPGIKGWAGPYLIGEKLFVDPWGNPMRYSRPDGKAYRLISAGPDGRLGTADDIQRER